MFFLKRPESIQNDPSGFQTAFLVLWSVREGSWMDSSCQKENPKTHEKSSKMQFLKRRVLRTLPLAEYDRGAPSDPSPWFDPNCFLPLPGAVPKKGLRDDASLLLLWGPPSAHGLVSWALQTSFLELRLAWQAVSDPCCLPGGGCSASPHGHERYGFRV